MDHWFSDLGQPPTTLKVSGEDAFIFLQGQFTQDLRLLAKGPVYGLWLNHRGRIEADCHLAPCEDGYLLFSYTTPASTLLARLERHRVADWVDFAPWPVAPRWLVCSLPDRAVPDAWPRALYLAPGRWGPSAYDVLLPPSAADHWLAALRAAGYLPRPPRDLDRARIEAGFLRVPQEAGLDDTPADVGLEGAVSFTKGCFTGQEVVARMHHKQRGIRGLYRLRFRVAPSLAAPATSLTLDGRPVGSIRAQALDDGGGVALASLRHDAVQGRQQAIFEQPGSPFEAFDIVPITTHA